MRIQCNPHEHVSQTGKWGKQSPFFLAATYIKKIKNKYIKQKDIYGGRNDTISNSSRYRDLLDTKS